MDPDDPAIMRAYTTSTSVHVEVALQNPLLKVVWSVHLPRLGDLSRRRLHHCHTLGSGVHWRMLRLRRQSVASSKTTTTTSLSDYRRTLCAVAHVLVPEVRRTYRGHTSQHIRSIRQRQRVAVTMRLSRRLLQRRQTSTLRVSGRDRPVRCFGSGSAIGSVCRSSRR
jgi:hypothetical protein